MSDTDNTKAMRTVDTLTPADRGTVWRCAAFTVAWIENSKTVATRIGTTKVAAWCRLDHHHWIPLDEIPAGPFHEIENPNWSDYRDNPSLRNFHVWSGGLTENRGQR